MMQFFVFYLERDYKIDENDWNEMRGNLGCASKLLDKLDEKSVSELGFVRKLSHA
jgi:hypothetical protein